MNVHCLARRLVRRARTSYLWVSRSVKTPAIQIEITVLLPDGLGFQQSSEVRCIGSSHFNGFADLSRRG